MTNKNFVHSKEILDFWFSSEVEPFWFVKDTEFDETIRKRFGKRYEEVALGAKNGNLKDFKTGKEALALIIVLDQFSRNMFRDSPQAFATDEAALSLAKLAVEKGVDGELTTVEQHNFLYMPFMHSENLEDQEEGIRLFSLIPGNANAISYSRQHRDIIARFGRFPHRNKVLGRPSTPEEVDFNKEFGGF